MKLFTIFTPAFFLSSCGNKKKSAILLSSRYCFFGTKFLSELSWERFLQSFTLLCFVDDADYDADACVKTAKMFLFRCSMRLSFYRD